MMAYKFYDKLSHHNTISYDENLFFSDCKTAPLQFLGETWRNLSQFFSLTVGVLPRAAGAWNTEVNTGSIPRTMDVGRDHSEGAGRSRWVQVYPSQPSVTTGRKVTDKKGMIEDDFDALHWDACHLCVDITDMTYIVSYLYIWY